MTDQPQMAAPPAPLSPVLQVLAEQFPAARFDAPFGQQVAEVGPADIVGFAGAARQAGFRMFLDLAAVDYLHRHPRFEVVVTLIAPTEKVRLRIRVPLAGGDPVMPSLTGVFPGANFYEREAFDLFGIRFEGHPDLTRILLPDEWVGHPLRKDSPVGSVPVQFKEPDAS